MGEKRADKGRQFTVRPNRDSRWQRQRRAYCVHRRAPEVTSGALSDKFSLYFKE
jgi:hypothetical protein